MDSKTFTATLHIEVDASLNERQINGILSQVLHGLMNGGLDVVANDWSIVSVTQDRDGDQ